MHQLPRDIAPFSSLTAMEFDHLASSGSFATYRDGATIVSEGREDSRLLFLIEGHAKVSRINEKGKEIILAQFSAGDYFGEISLLTGSSRTANVTATSLCKTFEISAESFRTHTSKHTGLMQYMLSEMAKRLHLTSEQMVDSAFLELPERLLKLLYAMSSISDTGNELRCIVRECPPHQELAAMVGASREAITRALRQLERDGHINRDDKTIFLPVADKA